MTVFICHASEDKAAVRKLNRKLKGFGYDTWLDEERLLPGQDWQLEITKAIRSASVVLVCLSELSTAKIGYIQKELRFAMDVALHMPPGSIFIIPCLLDSVTLPEVLRQWQSVDIAAPRAMQRLDAALANRYETLGRSKPSLRKSSKSVKQDLPRAEAPKASIANLTSETEAKLIRIIAMTLDVPIAAITPDSTLDELGADSLTALELALTIENEFSVTFPSEIYDDFNPLTQPRDAWFMVLTPFLRH